MAKRKPKSQKASQQLQSLQDHVLETSALVCAVPDHAGAGQLCRWPDGDIPWAIGDVISFWEQNAQGEWKRMPDDQLESVMRAAVESVFAHIASECGIIPHEVLVAAKARVYMTVGAIDGPGGTLAWAQLPCGSIRQSLQKYDGGERRLVIHPNGPWPQGTLDWWRVCLHETIHSLGIGHGGNDIMMPSVSPNVFRIGEWTRAELRRRYGPPKLLPPPVPTPTPTPAPPGGGFMEYIFKLIQFLKDNPWILDLIKRLFDKSAAQGGLTLADLDAEVQQLKAQQLQAPKP